MESAKAKKELLRVAESATLLALLAELLAMKRESLRELVQTIEVAGDALQPLADSKPVSGPAQRALVTIALMSLGQAREALKELEAVAERYADNMATGAMR